MLKKLIPIFCGITSAHVSGMVPRDVRALIEKLDTAFFRFDRQAYRECVPLF